MSRLLTCPDGHQWRLEDDASTPAAPLVCPVCGAVGDLTPTLQDGTVHAHRRPGPVRQPTMDANVVSLPPFVPLAGDDDKTMPPSSNTPLIVTSFAGVVPGYEVLGELGRGGMGVVYKARHVQLRRMVALKMILAGIHAGAQELARFRTEYLAVARLQHPNIVQVFEVGEAGGCPYFALEFVGGGSLAQRLLSTPQPPRQAAELAETLARAVHYAHERGVVHRDLKPANILLTTDNVPKITDFGLAKQLGEEGLTQTEAIMGTPSYMAPEQVAGKTREVGPAADIYALGAILYELLTGQAPFKGEDRLDTLELVRSQEPVPPSRLHPKVPRDLDTVCLKCLAKDPRRRYRTAGELADDLARFQAGQPVKARPVGQLERAWKWARRRPAVAGLLAALAVVVVAGFAGVTWSYLAAEAARRAEERQRRDAVEARDQAVQARAEAEAAREQAEAAAYFSHVAQARLEWQANNVAQAQVLLESCPESRRGWEWRYLGNVFNNELLTLRGSHGDAHVFGLAYDPNGQHFASAGGGNPFHGTQVDGRVWPGEVFVWDPREGEPVRRLSGHRNCVFCVAYSPDGRWLASGGDDGAVKVWDAAAGRLLHDWRGHRGGVAAVAFAPDGARLLSAGHDGAAYLWDLASGQRTRTVREPGEPLFGATFGPDARHVVLGGGKPSGRTGFVLVQHLDEPGVRTLRTDGAHIEGVAFGPDGRHVAAAAADGDVLVWDAQDGRLLHRLTAHPTGAFAVAFSPDGRSLASGGGDNTVRLWDTSNGRGKLTLRGHTAAVRAVSFHPHGRRLVSTGLDGTVREWDLTTGPEHRTLARLSAEDRDDYEGLAFDGQTQQVVAVRRGGVVEVEEPDTGLLADAPSVDLYPEWRVPSTHVVFSGDGRQLATVSYDNPQAVRLWERVSTKEAVNLAAHTGAVWHLALSRDGHRVAADGWSRGPDGPRREVLVWDAGGGREPVVRFPALGAGGVVRHGGLALAPDGRRLAYDDYDAREFGTKVGRALGTELAQRAAAPVTPHGPNPLAAVLRLLTQPRQAVQLAVRIRVWDVEAGREVAALEEHRDALTALAFSPDGTRLASASYDGRIHLWEVVNGQRLHTLRVPEPFCDLSFSPDGGRLAAVSRNVVMLWDTATGQEILTLRGAPPRPSDNGFNPRVAFSADGTRLAAVNWDRTISVWEAPPTSAARQVRRERAGAAAFGWHLVQARACLDAGRTFAADHHLKCLDQLKAPTTALAQEHKRLGQQRVSPQP